MVRSCLAEEQVSQHVEQLLYSRTQAEVGLLVGKPSVGSKDLILSLVRTPAQDGAPPLQVATSAAAKATTSAAAKKGGGGGKAGEESVQLESEWIAEHGCQVARMLPGGVFVLGLYLFCSDSGFASASGQLAATLQAMQGAAMPATTAATAAATTASAGSGGSKDDNQQQHQAPEPLLLHIDSGSRKLSLKSAPRGSLASSAFKPCELAVRSALTNLLCITCVMSLRLALPVASSTAELREHASELVARACEHIAAGVMVVDGHVPSDATPICDALPKSATASAPVAVELLCPPACSVGRGAVDAANAASSSSSSSSWRACGLGTLTATLHGIAYVSKRDSAARAAAELKADLQATLRTRIDVAVEDALAVATEEEEEQQEAAAAATTIDGKEGGGGGLKRPPLLQPPSAVVKCVAAPLPRRVLLPWAPHGLRACDHLLPGEGPDDACDRLHELLAVARPEPSAVEDPEPAPEAGARARLQPWDPLSSSTGAASSSPLHSTAGGGKNLAAKGSAAAGVAVPASSGSVKPPVCANSLVVGVSVGVSAVLVAAFAAAMTLGAGSSV